MTIENIRDFDDSIQEIIEINFHNSTSTFTKFGYPNVGRALTSFVIKANYIKNAIFDLCENDDPYSANILLRSLIEHHFKFMFIFMRHTSEKNDDVGIDYYQFCDFSESFLIGKSWLDSWQLLTPENESKLYEIIIQKEPKLKAYTKNEIIKKAKQFNYRYIVSFIKDSIEGGDFKGSWLNKIIPNYGDLSSYVHGGPLADKYLLYFSNETKRRNELINISKLTFLTANTLKQFIYILLSQVDNEQYTDSLKNIDLIISKFNKAA